MARPDFRATVGRRLSEERELGPQVLSLLSAETSSKTLGIRQIPVGRIEANPDQPRTRFEQSALDELTASVREHGILQPVLVRPLEGTNRFQLVAGERRWRAATAAGLNSIPALIEELDDDTALEIAIIENLQREDLSPLEEAVMYDRMVKEHGYSIRRLAQKLGKDKGYLENRLRLAGAPPEIQELVSVRKDTISHAYELLKVEDPKKRRRLAEQVARGELTLVKLRERVEGRRRPRRTDGLEETILDGATTDGSEPLPAEGRAEPPADRNVAHADTAWTGALRRTPETALSEDSLVNAKQELADALEAFVGVLREPDVLGSIGTVDRANLAKYLTIAKLRLENAIALVRSGDLE
ncbi:MAG: ParB/RepB/Spo0J family partition protein [Chloroflexota bacterium]|nr:ParB/RepB/Spo0J family partition protein [Chloroflexota bacterium]